MTTHPQNVAVFYGLEGYPSSQPYSPDEAFPEYPFAGTHTSYAANHAYRGVRGALQLLGLDEANFGNRQWNPLGELIQPGQTVVLKPNFVRDFRETHPDHGDCLITHGSVIRAVLDYVYIALGGRGRIIIADAPQNDADFAAIRRIAGLDDIQRFYKEKAGFTVEVYDLRPERARKIDGVIVGRETLPGDPAGYVKVNLGLHSAFAEINPLCHRLYGSEYDTSELHRHQHDDVHEYLISRTVLDADVVIGLPKLKTHKKVGLTVNLKNLVGINGNKNWLPHHREGTPAQGGDQFHEDTLKRRFERATVMQFKRTFPLLGPLRPWLAGPIKSLGKRLFGDTNGGTIRSGNWHGNDTAWRMALDLNRILFYSDSTGTLHVSPRRKFFSVVDGIVGGEGNGPLDATPKPAGVVLAGADPVAVDRTCARLMGFDYQRIPLLARANDPNPYPLNGAGFRDIRCFSNRAKCHAPLEQVAPLVPPFQPHPGWRGKIELIQDRDRIAVGTLSNGPN